MIPYWHFPAYKLGPFEFQTWGTAVALGILAAIFISLRAAGRHGVSKKLVWDSAFWIIVGSFIGARLGHVFFYEWPYFRENLGEIFKIWHGGFSSYGGFLGAALALLLFTANRKLQTNIWRFADIMVAGFPLGWTIGRIGCFLIHDHPGTLTDFALGVRYPDGVRHDLGLYEALQALPLALLLIIFRKKLEASPGRTLILVSLWYGIARFFLDFLRAKDGPIVDVRYFGLTPAQYGSIILISACLCFLFIRLRSSRVLR